MEKEKQRQSEKELPPYCIAAHFSSGEEEMAIIVYALAQKVIKTTECEMTVLRLLTPLQAYSDNQWFVMVFGEIPSNEMHLQITELLAAGEMCRLPAEVVSQLFERRKMQIQKGACVEEHYRVSVKNKVHSNLKRDPRYRRRKN